MNLLGISWEHLGNKKMKKIQQALTLPKIFFLESIGCMLQIFIS